LLTSAREDAGLGELLALPGKGKRFAALMPDIKSAALDYPDAPFAHAGAYYQAEQGGTLLGSFAAISHSAVQLGSPDVPLDRPGDPVPITWSWERHGALFDAVLVHGSDADVERIFGPGHRVETRGR